ncbi:hypothetical protein MMC30_008780 [Trapelia coarctata]|nr:hypothetical protein [Trapelia coarctata]
MTPKSNSRKSKKSTKQTDRKSNEVEKHGESFEVDLHHALQKPAMALRQSLLDVFKDSVSDGFNDTLLKHIQHVKGYLFDRDFDKAFGSKPLLEAYSLRWSPSRALAYLDLVCGLPQISRLFRNVKDDATMPLPYGQAPLPLDSASQPDTNLEERASATLQTTQDCAPSPTIVTCLGAGAGAEIMAFAGYMRCLLDLESTDTSGGPEDPSRKVIPPPEAAQTSGLVLKIVDMADWSTVIGNLHAGATTSPPFSKYAASNRKNQRGAFVDPEHFFVEFERRNILCMETENMAKTLRNSPLITLFFTLNELYSVSMSKTTNFLLNLTFLTQPGTLLLVVDSPGSYSTVRVGSSPGADSKGAERRYPMTWLLDHTLLEASSIERNDEPTQKRQWEKITWNDSRWFRLSGDLKYPLDLEDMRYQYHLYKRI